MKYLIIALFSGLSIVRALALANNGQTQSPYLQCKENSHHDYQFLISNLKQKLDTGKINEKRHLQKFASLKIEYFEQIEYCRHHYY